MTSFPDKQVEYMLFKELKSDFYSMFRSKVTTQDYPSIAVSTCPIFNKNSGILMTN